MESRCIYYFLLYFLNFVYSETESDLMTTRMEILETRHFVYWPNGTIPFYINPDHFDSEQAMTIMTTLSLIAFKSCLKFSPVMVAPGDNEHVLTFVNPTGVRKCDLVQEGHARDEPHILSIGYECLVTPWIDRVVLRALGLPLEHNRDVRDLYVDVQYENIEQNAIPLFTKNFRLPASLRALPYDINSVLHFGDRDYSKNGHRTLIFKEKGCEQKQNGPSDLDLRKIEIIYGPECRERDRQEKIELCHLYPGIPPSHRRKRSIDLVTIRSLRFNRDITPPPLLNHTLKLNLTTEDRDKFMSLNIDDEAQKFVDAAYKLTVKALNTARVKHCNDSNNLIAEDNKNDILGLLQRVAEFAISVVDHATLNQTVFCEESQTVERYHKVQRDHTREFRRSNTDQLETKDNPVSQTAKIDGRKSVDSPQFRVNDDDTDDAANKENDSGDDKDKVNPADEGEASNDRIEADKGETTNEHIEADKGETTNEHIEADKGETTIEHIEADRGETTNEHIEADKGETTNEHIEADKSETTNDRIKRRLNARGRKKQRRHRAVSSSEEEFYEVDGGSDGKRTIKSSNDKSKKKKSLESKDSEDESKGVGRELINSAMKIMKDLSKKIYYSNTEDREDKYGVNRAEDPKMQFVYNKLLNKDDGDEAMIINLAREEDRKELVTNKLKKKKTSENKDSEDKSTIEDVESDEEIKVKSVNDKSKKKKSIESKDSENESKGDDGEGGVKIKWESAVEEENTEDKSTSVKRERERKMKSAYEKSKKHFSKESMHSEDELKDVDRVGSITIKFANEDTKEKLSLESKDIEDVLKDGGRYGESMKAADEKSKKRFSIERNAGAEPTKIYSERGRGKIPNGTSKKEDHKESEDSEAKPTAVERGGRKPKASEKSKKDSYESRDDSEDESTGTDREGRTQKTKKYNYDSSDGSKDESTGIISPAPRTIELSKPTQQFYNDRVWPGGVVRYVINQDCTEFDVEDLRFRLQEVNAILRERTCTRIEEIRWGELTKYKDEGYLVLDNSEDYVTGRVGGEQIFGSPELLRGGQHRQHTAMMVMAMLGFYFEPARHDRDQYVRVHARHVVPGKLHHFEKLDPEATLSLPYDYESAMQPPWNFWRKPKKGISTVTTYKDNDPNGKIMRSFGQHQHLLSEGDILKINSVYGLRCMKSARRI